MSRTSTFTRTEADGPTENAVVAHLALAATQSEELRGHEPFSVIVPAGADLRIVDPEALLDAPTRTRGTSRPATVQGLLRYCGHHNEGSTEAWVSTEQIVAIINGRTPEGVPGWGDHRAVLTLAHSPEWLHWAKYDGTMLDQATFAEHVEEGMIDIEEPDSAEMLEIAQHFHVSRSHTFRSSQHLQSGRIGFRYDEEDAARAGSGKEFEIPQAFVLGIPVYEGEDAYRVRARFRYRLREGELTLGYKLDRPDLVKRDAAEQIATRLRDESTELFVAVYDGAPGEAISPGRIS